MPNSYVSESAFIILSPLMYRFPNPPVEKPRPSLRAMREVLARGILPRGFQNLRLMKKVRNPLDLSFSLTFGP